MGKELTIQTASQRQRLYEWSQKVVECRQSGMSVKRWCDENGTTPKTYYSWQKKVFAFMVEQQRLQLEEPEVNSERCFVELPSHYESIQQPPADLIAHVQIGDAAIDLYAGANADTVKAICQALRTC